MRQVLDAAETLQLPWDCVLKDSPKAIDHETGEEGRVRAELQYRFTFYTNTVIQEKEAPGMP